MLILGVGSGTKALPTFLNCRKTYETVVVFGAATDTYDRLGKVVARDETGFQQYQHQQEQGQEQGQQEVEVEKKTKNRGSNPYEHVTREKVLAALDKFKGKVWQIPPIYSAKWMNGKRLYDYARNGLPLPEEIKGKEVEVEEMEMMEWLEPGTHGYGIPDQVVDRAVVDGNGDGDGNAGNKERKEKDGGRIDEVAMSGSTEQMAKGVKRARENSDGRDDGTAIAAATSAPKPPSQTTSHSPKRAKLNTQVDEPIAKSHDLNDRTDTQNTVFTTTSATITASDANTSSSTSKTTNLNTASSSSSSLYVTSTISPESESKSQQPPEQKYSHHHHHNLPSPSPSSSSPPSPPAVKLRMTVSSGFYVRSLCHDLGIAVGSFAFMADLVRTRQAEFELGPENRKNRENDYDHNGKEKDKDNHNEEPKKKKRRQKKGNVLEYADLQKGEEVWGPRVKDLIRDDFGKGRKGSLEQGGKGRNDIEIGNGNENWRRSDGGRRNTSSPE